MGKVKARTVDFFQMVTGLGVITPGWSCHRARSDFYLELENETRATNLVARGPCDMHNSGPVTRVRPYEPPSVHKSVMG